MRFILASVILFLFSISYSQNKEGKITYSISYSNLPAELGMMESMLPKESVFYFEKDKSRMEQSIGFMGTQIVLNDNTKKMSYIFMDMMGNKVFMETPHEESDASQLKITYLDETKTIANYLCKKALIQVPGESAAPIHVYYTEEIQIENDNPEFKGLKGFPMEYQISESGMTLNFTVSKVDFMDIPDHFFEIPTGYTKVKPEDLMNMMGN